MAYGKNTYRGKYKVKNPEKYRGDPNNVVYRSSWETKFFIYCDTNKNVIEWASEEIVIPYVSPLDGKRHRYFVDGYMKVRQADGTIQKYMVEIKPKKYTVPPVQPQRKTQQYLQECLQYAVNQAKWEAATNVCLDNGWKFIILTEDHLKV